MFFILFFNYYIFYFKTLFLFLILGLCSDDFLPETIAKKTTIPLLKILPPETKKDPVNLSKSDSYRCHGTRNSEITSDITNLAVNHGIKLYFVWEEGKELNLLLESSSSALEKFLSAIKEVSNWNTSVVVPFGTFKTDKHNK